MCLLRAALNTSTKPNPSSSTRGPNTRKIRQPVLCLKSNHDGMDFNVKLTHLIIDYDWLCSFCHTTNLLKDCSLACVSPPNDKNMKMGALVLLPANSNHICHTCAVKLDNCSLVPRNSHDPS